MEETVRIDLGGGYAALIEIKDAERVLQHRWFWRIGKGVVYASCNTRTLDGRRRSVTLHRFIMDEPEGMDVDHRDGDGLNNRRSNLRVCTHRNNTRNKRMSRSNTLGYKGIVRRPNDKFVAQVQRGENGKNRITYGEYRSTPEEAARDYDRLAREIFGEFARTNESLGLLGGSHGG